MCTHRHKRSHASLSASTYNYDYTFYKYWFHLVYCKTLWFAYCNIQICDIPWNSIQYLVQPPSFAFLFVYILYSLPQWTFLCFYHTLHPHISCISPSLSSIRPFPMQWHSPPAQSTIILSSTPSHWNCMRCNCSVWCMNVCQRTAQFG